MIARCKTLKGAWKVIDLLHQHTRGWRPAVTFVVVLRAPEAWPEIHLDEGSLLRKQDLVSIKEVIKKLKEKLP